MVARSMDDAPTTAWLDEDEIRSLAVEIVDSIHGYTLEFSNQPSAHEADYDWVEKRITQALSGDQ